MRIGSRRKAAASHGVRQASAESLVRLHSSMPPHTASSSRSQPCGGAITFDIREPSREGMRGEGHTAGLQHGGADVPLGASRVGDLLVEAEHEQVPRLRRHLVPDEHEHAPAPALLAAAACLERVVIGEQHAVRARDFGRVYELGHGGGAVGVGGVDMRDAGEAVKPERVVHLGDAQGVAGSAAPARRRRATTMPATPITARSVAPATAGHSAPSAAAPPSAV